MRVFVIGTGRCGTTTFAQACRHVVNYRSGHETKAGISDHRRLEFPDDWIEVDPHLAFMIGPLLMRYPNAFFVHLQRSREEVVDSWFRRGIRLKTGPAPLINVICQTDVQRLSETTYKHSLEFLYDLYIDWIEAALRGVGFMHIWLHEVTKTWPLFWKRIGAAGNCKQAIHELEKRHNAHR